MLAQCGYPSDRGYHPENPVVVSADHHLADVPKVTVLIANPMQLWRSIAIVPCQGRMFEESLDELIATEVLREDPDGGLAVNDAVVASVPDALDAPPKDAAPEVIDYVDRFEMVAEVLKRELVGLAQWVDLEGCSREEVLSMIQILDYFLNLPETVTHGSPEGFLPIIGNRLAFYTSLSSCSIAYIWLDDCEPCDRMRDVLAEVFPEVPEGVSTYSVFGPECAQYLDERYDLTGGPVTLFLVNSNVDVRLQGAASELAVRKELEALTSYID